MNFAKKVIALFIIIFYIISNILFYNTIFNDYPNIILFKSSILLLIFEILFWIFLFSKLDNTDLNRIKSIEYLFIISLTGVSISRIFLHSSPYLNDLLNTKSFYIYLVGILRGLFIFSSIINIFYIKDSKSKILLLVSSLNLVTSIMIWLDFDSNINAILRILIGILILLYVIMEKRVFENSKNIEKMKIKEE